jgi:hypothetical protein
MHKRCELDNKRDIDARDTMMLKNSFFFYFAVYFFPGTIAKENFCLEQKEEFAKKQKKSIQ